MLGRGWKIKKIEYQEIYPIKLNIHVTFIYLQFWVTHKIQFYSPNFKISSIFHKCKRKKLVLDWMKEMKINEFLDIHFLNIPCLYERESMPKNLICHHSVLNIK